MEEDLLRYENELAAIYKQASVRIQADVRELLKRFSNRYGLSETEAVAMLDKPISPQEIAMLKMRLPLVQDEALKKAMQAKLEAQAYGYRMSRKEALGMDLQMHAQDIASRNNAVVSKALVNVAQSNDKRLLSDLGQQFKSKGINISPSFSQFSQGYIESLTKQRWYGKDFSQRVWDNTQRLAQKMNTAIMDDLVAGRSNARVAKTLQEEMGTGYKEAIRLVRTESNRVCNSADIERYKSLGIKYYKILATKDSRTSVRCRKEDGQVYPVEEAEAGKNMPPFHPNCRSTTTAVVKKQEIIKAQKAWAQEVELAPEGLPEPPRGLPDGNYPENPEGWKSNINFLSNTSQKVEYQKTPFYWEFYKISGTHTRSQDLAEVNPNFSLDKKWRMNCQRCVATYEMRRRGYDLTVKPWKGKDDKLPQQAFNIFKSTIYQCPNGDGMWDCINLLESWGDGSRAIIGIIYPDRFGAPSPNGHVFIGENINGYVYFLDPQINSLDCSSHFSYAVKGYTSISRIDNADTTSLIKKCCKKVKR